MTGRGVSAFGLALLILLSSWTAAPAWGDSGEAYPDGPLRVGLLHDYPPFSVVGPGGRPYGMLVDMWKLWAEATGVEVRFVVGSASQTLLALQNGRIDIHAGLVEEDGLDEWLSFSKPFHEIQSVLYVRAGSTIPDSIEALGQGGVAVLDGSFLHGFLTREHPTVTVVPEPSVEAMVKALLGGQVDAILGEVPILEAELARESVQGAVARASRVVLRNELKGAVLKQRNELLTLVSEGFDNIPLARILAAEQRWFPNPEDRYLEQRLQTEGVRTLDLSDEERAWIKEHPRVVVAIMDAWPPLDYLNSKGLPRGIGVDVLHLVAQRTGLDIHIVGGQFADNLRAVRDKRIDALMDVTPKPDREGYLNFTREYLSVPHVFIGRAGGAFYRDASQLAGKLVALERGFGNVAWFRIHHPDVEIGEYEDTAECLAAVSRGEAEAYAGNRVVATYIMAREFLTNLRVMGRMDKLPSVLAVGVRKDAPLLASILDKALADITPAEMNAILQLWAGYVDETTIVELTPEQREWVEAHPVIRVAATSDWPPFEFEDTSGSYAGITADVFRLVAQRIGLEAEFVLDSWPELLKMLHAGQLDVGPGMSRSPQREAGFVFTRPFITSFVSLWVAQDNQDIRILDDLNLKVVAVEDGSYMSELLAEKYPEIGQMVVPSTMEALKAVASGRADAYLGVHAVAAYLTERFLIQGLKMVGYLEDRPLELAMGVRDDRPILRDILQQGLDSLSEEDMRAIQEHYLHGETYYQEKLHLTDGEQAWLAEHRNIRLGVDASWLPFEGLGENGEYLGVLAEYVAWISKTLDVDMKPLPRGNWAVGVELIRRGDLDVISGLSLNRQFGEQLNFTQPYLSMPLVLVTREDAPFVGGFEDLEGKTVAVVRGYLGKSHIERDHPGVQVLLVDGLSEALDAVVEGRAEALMDSLGAVTYAIRTRNIKGLKVASTTPYLFELSFAVRKDWPELVSILDKALASIPRTDRQSFYDRWVNVRVASLVDWGAVWRGVLIVGCVALVVLGLTFWWNRKLAGEIAERKAAQKRLEESEAKVQAMSQAVHDGLIMVDGQARIMYWNHAAERLFGIPVAEAMGRDARDLFVSQGLETFRKTDRGPVLDTLLELVALRADGAEFPVEVGVSGFQVDDQWYIVGTIRDITDRKQAEQALNEALERNRGILTSMGEGLFGMDAEGKTTFINPAGEVMLGYDPDELMGRNIHAQIHHTDNDGGPYPEEECPMYLAYARGKPYKVVNELLWRKDGTSFPVEYSAAPLCLGEKVTGAVVAFRDISERLEAEQTVRLVREELQQIFDNAQVGILFLRGGRKVYRCNARFAQIFGYDSPKDVVGMNITHFHSSVENFAEFSREHLPALRRGQQVQVEYEFNKRKDGTEFWSAMTGRAMDPDIPPDLGKGLIWVIDDISARKRAEAEVLAAHEQLQHILDTSPVGVAFSLDGILKFANPTFVEMFGIGAGASSFKLYADPEVLEELVQRLREGELVHNLEVRMYNADGTPRDMLTNYQPLEYNGEQGVLAWLLDITERKRAEDKIRRNLEELERFNKVAVGREERMIQLKEEINELMAKLGSAAKYKIVE